MIKSDYIKSRVGLLKLRKNRRRKVKVQKMLQNERNNSTEKMHNQILFHNRYTPS